MTRSFSEALLYRHSERGITKILICERSELEVDEKKIIYERRELRVKNLIEKIWFFENSSTGKSGLKKFKKSFK